ncbi:hypothetical protein P879_07619 [Paragonimus westermani]|uniref:JmjC domain-containing protein n=1 Tax=Paragonimus westermani TaxID=34504 RepID=A0A8T0D2H2_9TREM|nr:hypothetical protein P879_07619 [Paragonimus westermani]
MVHAVSRRRFERSIRKAKLKARSELGRTPSRWWHLGFAKTFDLSSSCFEDNCPRIDAKTVTLAEFRADYEQPLRPVIIQNDQFDWCASKKWTLDRLARKYRNQRFKCGEDDNGCSVRVKMKYFVQYMRETQDDSPLYIFDANFGEHRKKKNLLNDYNVSKYFPEDLFIYGSEKRRPPFRWFVMGPARSGTGIHVDPLGTSAWNALVVGQKRWCMFPPQTPKELVKPKPQDGGENKNEAIAWFAYVYPRTRLPDWPQTYKPLEVLQHAGETIFVPCGWWHVVLNLTDTVAVTQNFCSSVNFPVVWHKTARARPRFADSWLTGLRIHHPELAALADKIDISKPLDNMPSSSSSSASSSSSSSSSSSTTCSSSCCSACDQSPPRSRPKVTKLNVGRSLSPRLKSPSPKRTR